MNNNNNDLTSTDAFGTKGVNEMRRNALCGAVALVPSMPEDRIRLGGRPGQPSRPPPPLWLIALALMRYGGNLEVAAQNAKTPSPRESEP
ncbi:unnamed protein product [Haemonchus placei]|uniref:DUF4235 domain-containing protein n=1 Tax=Haemonchus placei TaxID=6290 RepID=A0A0N4W5S0_HAEPC|nr:unnamed protein product [Haemonchus placei]